MCAFAEGFRLSWSFLFELWSPHNDPTNFDTEGGPSKLLPNNCTSLPDYTVAKHEISMELLNIMKHHLQVPKSTPGHEPEPLY